MKSLALAGGLAAFAMTLAPGIVIAQRQDPPTPPGKPTVTQTVSPPQPMYLLRSWEDALAHADTVVRVRITARQYVKVPLSVKPFNVDKTRYAADVLEILRSPIGIGPSMTIYRGAGVIETPTRFVKLVVPGYPEWTLHAEYLLLLQWDSLLNGFNDAYGPDGTFKLSAGRGRVESTGGAPFSKAHKDRPVPAFLAEARTAAGR
jgi:hypothetical protein